MIPILGMHRSGTSAVAGALHKLGADLGSESSWLHAAADNPRGFFEYKPVVDLDKAVLTALGGTWSSPPPLPAGWLEDDRLIDLRRQAEDLSAVMSDRMVVKDPRLSLLQPLWDQVRPAYPGLLCWRHPSAVADSLVVRNKFSVDQGLFLWFRYNAAALLNRPDSLVTAYESLLERPAVELRRIADHIGLHVSEKTIEAAAGTISHSMAHHAPADLPDSPIGVMCQRLYDLLRSGRGLDTDHMVWVWARVATELPWAGQDDRDISRLRREVAEARNEIKRLEVDNRRQQRRLERLDSELRHALRVVDIVSVSETTDLLRQLEGNQR